MANKDEYLNGYREFFEYFAETVNPNDQLPVKLGSYKLLNVEVVGGIIDWTSQYLSQKKCPQHLFSPLIKIIIEEIRKGCKKDPIYYGFNSIDNAYEPLKLMQAVMAKTNEVCLRYLDNSMLCSLPAPTNTCYETSICTKRNRRRRMEDRHVAIHDLNTMFNIQEATPSSYYAVFDGHAGHDAAAYSAAHLHQFLAENKHFATNPDQALKDAFCKTDALFIEKCNVESLTGGTTAVVALLRPKEKSLYIAWVGDSQALLVKQGKILQCVNPHKPSREDERERIESAGGCVMLWGTWRVNGQLAVSRAIGDADYKPHVTAIPDVKEILLDGAEDFLIIACDGLWDFVTEDAAAQEVYYMIAENPGDTERISKHLVHLSCYQGSTDNISVIVVFLRDPHLIAAEAPRWANKNGPPLSSGNMETGLDNANNPFASPNGSLKNLASEAELNLQKNNDGLLLNLSESFKANGTDLSKDIFGTEKLNGSRKSTTELNFDDEFGPETNVDTVDDVLSPIEKEKAFTESLVKGLNDESISSILNDEVKFTDSLINNNPLEANSNPFSNNQQGKDETFAPKELNFDDDFTREDREETPTPPVDAVQDGGGLEVNPTESDSEDEWNYIKGDQANPENTTLQPETVVETSEPDDAMSQLNPNAAEFVPVSPTRSIPSPACRTLFKEEIFSESPKRPARVDISVPSETEFETEVKSRPSDFDQNGHNDGDELNSPVGEPIEKILNGKSLDEIPEFQPSNIPTKPASEEFHFGPNAAPFIPELNDSVNNQNKLLDQSEAFSTKAEFGDDTAQLLNTSFDNECPLPNKEDDPMSRSFYAENGEIKEFLRKKYGESNPLQGDDDLNRVHVLPENLDEFLGVTSDENKENIQSFSFNETISDLPEHDPLERLVDNDIAAVQTTDLDKLSQDDEKELASPLEENSEPLDSNVTTQPNEIISEVLVHESENGPVVASSPELEPVASPEPLESPIPPSEPIASPEPLESPIPPSEPIASPEPLESPIPPSEPIASPVPSTELLESPSEPVAPSPQPDLIPSTEQTLEVAPQSPVVLTPEPQSDLDQLEVIEKVDTPVSQEELLEEISNHLDAETTEVDVLQADDSAIQSPVELASPVCELTPAEDLQQEFEPKKEVEFLSDSANLDDTRELSVSPVPVCEYSESPDSCAIAPKDLPLIGGTQSPIDLLQEVKQEEEITSSVKDDVSSPVEPLSQASLVEDSQKEDVVEVSKPVEVTEPQAVDILSDLACPLPTSQPLIQPDVVSSLELSSPGEQLTLNGLELAAVENNEQICIRTDSIKPEYPESEILSPSEESRGLDEPNAPSPLPVQAEIPVDVPEKTLPVNVPEETLPGDVSEETLPVDVLQETLPVDVPEEPLPVQSEPEPVVEPTLEVQPQLEPVFAEPLPVEPVRSPTPEVESEPEPVVPTLPAEPEPVASPTFDAPAESEPLVAPLAVESESEAAVSSSLIEQPEPEPVPVSIPEPVVAESIAAPSEPELVIAPVVPEIEVSKPVEMVLPSIKSEVVSSSTEVPSKQLKTAEKDKKKPIGKAEPRKLTSASPKVGEVKPPTRSALSASKTAPTTKAAPKTGTSKSPAAVPKTSTAATRPKTATTTSKPTETKAPAANAKPVPKTITRKVSNEAPATKTINRSTTAPAPKASPTKTTAPRPTTAPRTSLQSKTTTTTAPPKATAPPKTRVLLSSRTITATSTATGRVSATTTTTKTTTTKTAPSTKPKAAVEAPKPRTITSTAPKPRAPATKTVTKSADIEKEKKENANKLAASRTTTVTRTTTGRVQSVTQKKTEVKTLSERTLASKTTTTTKATSVAKKAGEVKPVAKAKTTKIEKPKQNGIAPTSVTEEIKEINIVNNVVNQSDSSEILVKDNSPLDNKLLIETNNSLVDTTPAD